MACENDKCEKYGMHHEYKDGVEVKKCQFCKRHDQPERSKREDFLKVVADFEVTKEFLDQGPQPPKIPSFKEMRCSELYGNIERDK